MVRDRARPRSDEALRWLEPLRRFLKEPGFWGALDLLLPVACVSCEALLTGRDTGVVCGLCWARLGVLPSPQCERCGHPLQSGPCRWCDQLPPFVRAARSVCWMPGDPASAIVHALKYGGWTRAASGMADRMARLSWPRDVLEERAALVPVPLAAARTRERGYNQSLLLAVGLAERWTIPVLPNALVRARATRSQTELTPGERLNNVAGSFRIEAADRQRMRGCHLVLVDDVVTTGATLNECARVLFEGGARIISYVTFGRARASGDRL